MAPELCEVACREPWDAVVLGAGPAGAIAARQLARAGLSVLLVDKQQVPRPKVCGGCLGAAALQLLDDLGLGQAPAACGGVPLDRMELASSGQRASFAIDRRIAVARDLFDAALVHEAVRAGATFVEHTRARLLPDGDQHARRVVLERDGRRAEIRSRFAIDAMGLAGGGRPRAVAAANSRIGLGAIVPSAYPREGLLQMAWSSAGYVGIAPLVDGALDIAAAVDPRALAAAASPAEVVQQILDDAGIECPADLQAAAWRGTPPLTRRAIRLAAHRTLLVGDAAGYVEPFTGEGIGWAMHTAVLASELIAEHRERWTPSCQRQYEVLYRRTLCQRQRYCYVITRLLRNAPLRAAVVRGLSRAPWLSRPIIRRLERPLSRRSLLQATAPR